MTWYRPHPRVKDFSPPNYVLDQLVESMREYGFDPCCPIPVWRGMLPDGNTRQEAARRAGVEPEYRDISDLYDDQTIVDYILRANTHRQITPAQRAIQALNQMIDEPSDLKSFAVRHSTTVEHIGFARQWIQYPEVRDMAWNTQASINHINARMRKLQGGSPGRDSQEIGKNGEASVIRYLNDRGVDTDYLSATDLKTQQFAVEVKVRKNVNLRSALAQADEGRVAQGLPYATVIHFSSTQRVEDALVTIPIDTFVALHHRIAT